jgi:hypothetical protein
MTEPKALSESIDAGMGEPVALIGFVEAMNIVERGFIAWKDKSHNRKWFKRIDGTPIPNDIAVNIAEAICDAKLYGRSPENRRTLAKNVQRFDITAETIQTLLDLLNPLHGDLDKQTYDAKVAMEFDMPADYAHDVCITAQQERDLCQAVLILEHRKREIKAAVTRPHRGVGE